MEWGPRVGCRGELVVVMKGRKPPFASGVLAEDYSPLFEYWRVARERGREDLVEASMLREDDYSYLRELVGSGGLSVDVLMEKLSKRFESRVDGDVAVEAFRRSGISMDRDLAKRRIASLIAAWLLEAGESWGLLKLRFSWTGS